MKDHALRYADRGWRVFPLHSIERGHCSCGRACGKNAGKHPRTMNGVLDASGDPDQVERWWRQWPEANIGIATGEQSDLWVVDVDGRESVDLGNGVIVPQGENSLRMVEDQLKKKLPETLTVMTGGGGYHMLYRYPDDGKHYGNRAKFLPSVDIRGEGGYIVAPPSTHLSGARYEWVEEDIASVAAPDWFTAFQFINASEPFETLTNVVEGQRNDYLFRYASRLRGVEGLSYDELVTRVMGHNRLACTPPLEDAEVLVICGSAMKYDPNPGVEFPKVGEEVPELDEGDDLAISLYSLMTNPPPLPTPIVHGGLLDEGDGFILAGVSGVGKSWMGLDLSIAIASGTAWFDHFKTNQGPVLYVDEEGSMSGMYSRMRKLLRGRGLENPDIPVYLAVQRGIKLDNPLGLATVSRMLHRYRPKIVIFDTLVRMHQGEENSAKDMAAFFDISRSLRDSYGCAIGFIHHVRKPSKEDSGDIADLLRGSSDIRGWPDSIVMARRNVDEKFALTINHAKSREHEQLGEFQVKMVIDNQAEEARLTYSDVPVKADDSSLSTPERIVKAITMLQAQHPPTEALIAATIGVSPRTVGEYLKTLVADGHINKIKEGRENHYVVPRYGFTQREL